MPVLLGFALLRFTHFFKRSFAAKAGYEFFFMAALAGAALLMLAHVAVLLATTSLCGETLTSVRNAWKEVVPFDHSGKLAIATMVAVSSMVIMNRCITDQDAAARWAKRTEGGAEALLRQSLEHRKLVEVSTKSGRSYVGFVLLMGVQEANWTRDVLLLPMASGYRDSETRSLRLTTNYARLTETLQNHEVAVMMSEITAIRRFDLDVHIKVSQQSQQKTKRIGDPKQAA